MAPTIDYATIVILDIGKNIPTEGEKGQKSFFENAKKCAARIIERNIMIQSKNFVGVILLGSKTKNALAEQCKGSFKYIDIHAEVKEPTWDMIRTLPGQTTNKAGDWFEALIVAAHYYKECISGVKINSKKIVLISNLEHPAVIGKSFEQAVMGFKEDNIEVYVIGADEQTNTADIENAKTFVDETNGDMATLEQAMQSWMFHQKKAKKMTPQSFDLSIGPNIKIPISMYIRVKDEQIVKNWQKCVKDPVTLTASTAEAVKREKKFTNVENQTVPKETVSGYMYGQEVIPFTDSDKLMLYASGERSMSLYGFTSATNIEWQNLNGDANYYLFGRKGDKKAQYTITCLVQCLHELKLVGLVRKVHVKNCEPKMFAMIPLIDSNDYICFSLINICYKEEIKNMAFPPTELKKYDVNEEQVNAFKELISVMDLMHAYDDEEDNEAFPIAETVSPSIQYILDCISFRAMNPGKPLPQPRDEIMTLFKVPPLIEKRSRDPIEKLKKVFTLKKIEEKKGTRKNKRLLQPQDDEVKTGDDQTDVEMKNDDMPKVHLPIKPSQDINTIGTVDPIKDFRLLKDKGKSLSELVPELTEVIENLVYTNFGGDFTKPLKTMKVFREECLENDPIHYNDWLKKFKKDLSERKNDNFLKVLSENQLNFILQSESSLSTLVEDLNDDSQIYDNDTMPDSTELIVKSEINDLFDEM